MPYSRRRRFNRRYSRRRMYKPRRAFRRYVHRAISSHIEKKWFLRDLHTNWASIGNWIEYDVCQPGQGNGINYRQGRKIKITSLYIKGNLVGAQEGTIADDAYNTLRFVVGLWTGSQLNPLSTASMPLGAPIMKDYALHTLKRKYRDFYVNIICNGQGFGTSGYLPGVKKIKIFIKFRKPITITYADDTINFPDQRLMLGIMSDSTALTHPGFETGFCICHYEDA